ncbi:MAG: DUF4381 domain-containing protein [Proteobacteria bacterium]|nr:DUF4381 domain-containing protein [Pseudomonadota bacterium]
MDKASMDKTAPALELRDIHLPADPSIWPLAVGWWILIVVVGIVIYFLYKKWAKLKQLKQVNQLLQSELLSIRNHFKQHQDKHQLAAEISELLKRFVRHVLKDSNATSLTGQDWINYLNNRVNSDVFSPFQTELTQAQYIKNIEFDVPRLLATVKNYFPVALKHAKEFEQNKLKKALKQTSEKQHA